MKTDELHYAILGDGRLARHLHAYLALLDIPHSGWARNPASPCNSSAHPDAARRLDITLIHASHVLLLVSDDALAPLLRRYPQLHSRTLVHCAGALSLPGVAGAHPLMTFGREPYDLERYRRIPFLIESGHVFDEVLPGLPNPHHTVNTGDKALYHALCVIAGNFPQLLWQAVAQRFEHRLDLPTEVLRPYLQQTLENFLSDPGGALTGPLARDDRRTVQRNLTALGDDALAGVYESMEQLYLADRSRRDWQEAAS